MRHMIKGLVAAFAVTTAGVAPAMACGYGGCCGEVVSPCATTYAPAYSYQPSYSYAPAYTYTQAYSGCGACGTATTGWGYDRLAEPTTQYYYVNQGPTYSGPGAFAPEPTYQEDEAPAYGYHWRHHYHYRPYGYHYGYAPHHYGYMHHYGYRYGYMPRHYGYRYGGEGAYWGHHLVRRYY